MMRKPFGKLFPCVFASLKHTICGFAILLSFKSEVPGSLPGQFPAVAFREHAVFPVVDVEFEAFAVFQLKGDEVAGRGGGSGIRLFVRGDDLLDLLSSMFDTGDYGTPVAVYRLEQQDPRAWMESLMSEEERALYQ